MTSIGTKFVLAQRYIFDPNNNSLIDQIDSSEITRLGNNESRILLMLSERPNQVISRDELHEFVWRDQGFQVDDSSLTQAISTLRKVLDDSTKSPQYVKTVPKRGYQFIATVERSIPLASGSRNPDTQNNSSEPNFNNGEELSSNADTNKENQILAQEKVTFKPKSKLAPLTILLLFIAISLPILVTLAIDPRPSSFRLVETVNGIPIKTTENHPPLDEWQPLIHNCVQAYLSNNETKPIEVIATTGPRNNFILNYIYSEKETNKNETIQLVANQQEIAKLCQ